MFSEKSKLFKGVSSYSDIKRYWVKKTRHNAVTYSSFTFLFLQSYLYLCTQLYCTCTFKARSLLHLRHHTHRLFPCF